MNGKEIKNILKSGEFTIIYTDNGECQLYKGFFDLDDIDQHKPVHEFDDMQNGYTPGVVKFLVMALGGYVDSF